MRNLPPYISIHIAYGGIAVTKNYFETPVSWIDSEALSLLVNLKSSLHARTQSSIEKYSAFTVLSMGQFLESKGQTDYLDFLTSIPPPDRFNH